MKKLILILIVLSSKFAFSQCILQEVSFDKRASNSTIVFEGKVLNQQSFWNSDKTLIYTSNSIEVYKIFKGNITGTKVEFITEGGAIENEMQTVQPSLTLHIGEIGTFFSVISDISNSNTPAGTTVLKPYASSQGFIHYDEPTQTARDPFKNYVNLDKDVYKKLTTKYGQEYKTIKAYNVGDVNKSKAGERGSGVQVASYSPGIVTAGTKNKMTVTGSGFGTLTGTSKIEFTDASYGEGYYSAALANEIVSWTDNQIEVNVPSNAGTGKLRITNSAGVTIESDQGINITYSILNTEYNAQVYERDLVDDDTKGGYTFNCYKGFESNTPAFECFKRALSKWTCGTRVNFKIGPSTDVNVDKYDQVNIVRFDQGDELPDGVLGWCRSYASGNSSSGVWWIKEIDLTFNDKYSWQFGPANPSNSQFDFESVVVHELGHGHELGHVIADKQVMNRSISPGVTSRNLDAGSDLAAGKYISSKSAIANTVGPGPMTLAETTNCSNATTAVEQPSTFDGTFSVNLYPNPVAPGANTQIHINLPTDGTVTCSIYNMMGQIVKEVSEDHFAGPATLDIPTSDISSGNYLYTIKFNLKTMSGKFTKLSTPVDPKKPKKGKKKDDDEDDDKDKDDEGLGGIYKK